MSIVNVFCGAAQVGTPEKMAFFLMLQGCGEGAGISVSEETADGYKQQLGSVLHLSSADNPLTGETVTTLIAQFDKEQFASKANPGAIVDVPGVVLGTLTLKSTRTLPQNTQINVVDAVTLRLDKFAPDALPGIIAPAGTDSVAAEYSGTVTRGAILTYIT